MSYNTGQTREEKMAYLYEMCNLEQRPETHCLGLWSRRSRVRAPSVTLAFVGET